MEIGEDPGGGTVALGATPMGPTCVFDDLVRDIIGKLLIFNSAGRVSQQPTRSERIWLPLDRAGDGGLRDHLVEKIRNLKVHFAATEC